MLFRNFNIFTLNISFFKTPVFYLNMLLKLWSIVASKTTIIYSRLKNVSQPIFVSSIKCTCNIHLVSKNKTKLNWQRFLSCKKISYMAKLFINFILVLALAKQTYFEIVQKNKLFIYN